MLTQITLFTVSTLLICTANAAVLLWSKEKIEISPLTVFDDNNLDDLVKELQYPEVAIYKGSTSILSELEGLLDGYHTAYSPNGDVNTENATEIVGRDDLVLLDTKQHVDSSKDANVLSVLVLPNLRQKRDANSVSSSTEASETSPKGPILYRGKSSTNVYSLLYSSQPLILRSANTSVELGGRVLVTIDMQSKTASPRMDASVRVGEEKFILQFLFTWQSTYWSLLTIKVKSTMSNSSTNLIISDPFSVPARFSYHCSGVTVFSDANKTTELLIHDLQVQPDSKGGAFGDVYDCVDFTTVPIWSGLLVTALLGIGLMIALTAIGDIKTMDKFDNQKTKQLVITVAE